MSPPGIKLKLIGRDKLMVNPSPSQFYLYERRVALVRIGVRGHVPRQPGEEEARIAARHLSDQVTLRRLVGRKAARRDRLKLFGRQMTSDAVTLPYVGKITFFYNIFADSGGKTKKTQNSEIEIWKSEK